MARLYRDRQEGLLSQPEFFDLFARARKQRDLLQQRLKQITDEEKLPGGGTDNRMGQRDAFPGKCGAPLSVRAGGAGGDSCG